MLARWRSIPNMAFTVNRMAFVPPPKVTSAVVHIVPATAPEGVGIRTIEALTAAAFGQRRKMLRQSLKSLPGALAALSVAGVADDRRAETLAIEEFVAIGRVLEAARALGADG